LHKNEGGGGEEDMQVYYFNTTHFLHYPGKRAVDLDTINIHIFQLRNVSI
jgi:hypothetical protein